MKRTMLALGITMFALAGTANAKAPTNLTAAKAFKGHLTTTLALSDLGGVSVSKAKAVTNSFGRKDMMVSTKTRFATVVANVKKAYRSRKPMFSGYQVTGWAFLDARGTYMVTLVKDGRMHYAEMSAVPGGTNMRILGFSRLIPKKR